MAWEPALSLPQITGLKLIFDFIDHELKVTTSQGQQEAFDLHDGLSVSEFYQKLLAILSRFDIKASILAKPYDQPFDAPFAEDRVHKRYDKDYVGRYWNILSKTDHVFRLFNRDFCGKICPVQLYWHSFDLVVTRFSGERGPDMSQASLVEREAYSHKVISFGFWPGGYKAS